MRVNVLGTIKYIMIRMYNIVDIVILIFIYAPATQVCTGYSGMVYDLTESSHQSSFKLLKIV